MIAPKSLRIIEIARTSIAQGQEGTSLGFPVMSSAGKCLLGVLSPKQRLSLTLPEVLLRSY